MLQKNKRLKPRKIPVQNRSAHTVDAILEATIQVLLALGPDKLTTTKVADRAGVSVGTLYQYFGDKQGLLAAVTEQHLLGVIEKVEQACGEYQGLPLEEMVNGVLDAFFAAKFERAEVSKVLYSIAHDVEAEYMIATLMLRIQTSINDLIKSSKELALEDRFVTGFVLTTSLLGPVQTLLQVDASEEYRLAVKAELKRMLLNYLRAEPPPQGNDC